MTQTDISHTAQAFIEGEWFYDIQEKSLKKVFATDQELIAQKLVDDAGYMLPELKEAIKNTLGPKVLEGTLGPFGDDDIFSGTVEEDMIHYNIELHHISEANLDALGAIKGVHIHFANEAS